MTIQQYIEFFKNCDSCWANLGDPDKERCIDEDNIKELILLLQELIWMQIKFGHK